MSQPLLLKVYGHLSPATDARVRALEDLCREAIRDEDETEPMVSRLGDMLRLSFEGLHFPVEEAAAWFEAAGREGAAGRLDFLDLEAWRLTRLEAAGGRVTRRSASLNNVLDYSGF